MPEIISNSPDPIWRQISNLQPRKFIFPVDEERQCGSIEGSLQALKFQDPEEQRRVCLLSGKEAQHSGQGIEWSKKRMLYDSKGNPMYRSGPEFKKYIEAMYDAASPSLMLDLLKTGHADLRHSIGKSHQYRTVITEIAVLYHLYRLRAQAHREEEQEINRMVCNSF